MTDKKYQITLTLPKLIDLKYIIAMFQVLLARNTELKTLCSVDCAELLKSIESNTISIE